MDHSCDLLLNNHEILNKLYSQKYWFFLKYVLSKKSIKIIVGRPNILDIILNLDCEIYINTSKAFFDGVKIRRAAMTHKIPCIRNLSAALALAKGIDFSKNNEFEVFALQDF